METLAIIPARGGSKGIPFKNIAPLCGKPLIAYSIESALNTRGISRVIVSTDDEKIARVAQHHGAEVPFLRPGTIAGDGASPVDAVKHALSQLKTKGYVPEIFIILFPTHPFRPQNMMDLLMGKLMDGHRSVITVKQIRKPSLDYFTKEKDHILTPLKRSSEINTRGVHTYFRTYGSLIGNNRNGDKETFVYTLKGAVTRIDIDSLDDLRVAEAVINKKMTNIGSRPFYPENHACNHTHIF